MSIPSNHRSFNYSSSTSSYYSPIPSLYSPSSSALASRRVSSPISRGRLPFKTPTQSTPSSSPLGFPHTSVPSLHVAHANLHPLPTPPSSAFKPARELVPPPAPPPPQTPKSIFRQLSLHVLQHSHSVNYEHNQLELLHVSPIDFQAFLTLHGQAAVLAGIKLEYDAPSCRIIMCPPPAPYHDCTPVFLQSVLHGLRSNPSFDTPARQRSLSVREIGFRSRDGSYLVPDAAVVAWSRGRETREWPTIVVEVANSQGYPDVLAKVRRWFVKSHGKVEVALLLKFTAKNPLLDPACFLEVWRCRRVLRAAPETDGVNLNIVDFETDTSDEGEEDSPDADQEDYLEINRKPVNPSGRSIDQEGDILHVCDPLPNFDDDSSGGSDGSLSTIDDDNFDFASPINNVPIIVAPSASNSDSSLSSLDDEDQDGDILLHTTLSSTSATGTTTTSSSASSSSNSSSASTSAFHPIPSDHKREIYHSGSRITILPVTDPETRYLDLLYSDFFGSDNVPEDRDGNEPVQVDLEELRNEIELLMQVTVDREERAKKHVAATTGGGGKRIRR